MDFQNRYIMYLEQTTNEDDDCVNNQCYYHALCGSAITVLTVTGFVNGD